MPIYAYKCKDCGKEFKILQSMHGYAVICQYCDGINVCRNIGGERDIKKVDKTIAADEKVGKKTDRYINELKEDLNEYQEALKQSSGEM
jgi:putative FmdB family regulatory protein